MKNWNIFYDALAKHIWMAKHAPQTIESKGESEELFTSTLLGEFEKVKLYSVQEDVHELLLRTKGTKDIPHMPFPEMFIDVDFDVSDLHENNFGFEIQKICGMMVCEMDFISMFDKDTGKHYRRPAKGIRIYILCLDKSQDALSGYSFNTVNVLQNDWMKNMLGEKWNQKVDTAVPKIRQRVLNYASNLMNMLLNKDREVAVSVREPSLAKNKQRERDGQLKIPSIHVVTPIGTLREYIHSYKSVPNFGYSHSFDVAGHWKHWNNPRYKEMRGRRTFVGHFVKGKGIYIPKLHDVVKQGQGEAV